MTVAADGQFGCAASQIAYDTVMKDGSTIKMNLRELDALKKIDGQWRVVQQHISFPVDPATMMAQTVKAKACMAIVFWHLMHVQASIYGISKPYTTICGISTFARRRS